MKLKHNANRAKVQGKRVVLVDDSIVRGTTSKKIVGNDPCGPAHTEVHMRISSPPTSHSCFYGIDTPERSKLLAARMDEEGAWRSSSAPITLAFITIDGLYRAMGHKSRDNKTPQ